MDWRARLELSSDSFTPLYAQLADRLREACRDLPAGTLMPSETELMAYTGVSRATARKAVGDLVGEGLVYSARGKGTFIAGPRVTTELSRPVGFTEAMRARGLEPVTRLLRLESTSAVGSVARGLGLQDGAEVLRIERLRLLRGEPCMIETTHLAAALAPGLAAADLEGSLYRVLEERWGLIAARGQETIIAINADRDAARLLGVPIAAALLSTLRTTQTADGVPLEYTLRQARGDMCSFGIDLNASATLSAGTSAEHPLRVGVL
ncbi:MAG: GntR family transcriptional regulator [Candidatus Nanopelagicales bacterium]|nr:GntR family transcriptional regulator [Candidatus Nanopelagicales bacterium]MCF8536397.1 GntR family transcriptional regulator [Candidatus Nanopelagicales bacterium]MCF8541523.1 GntR family transcriptional regulator [Candidatus Nanopelagicales bacterium]MCF8557087.1 GntR family transcriptional regulator [Candidatus Nanopelagicales bacterium]